MSFNYLDIAIGVILLIFGFIGLKRGIIAEVASLLALWLGISCARRYSGVMAQWLDETFHWSFSDAVSYIVTFLLAFLFMILIGKIASKLAENVGFGIFDKIGGFVLRVFEGLLVCGMLIVVMKTTGLENLIKQEDREQSTLYGVSEKIIPVVSSWAAKTGDINFNPIPSANDNPDVQNEEEVLPMV